MWAAILHPDDHRKLNIPVGAIGRVSGPAGVTLVFWDPWAHESRRGNALLIELRHARMKISAPIVDLHTIH